MPGYVSNLTKRREAARIKTVLSDEQAKDRAKTLYIESNILHVKDIAAQCERHVTRVREWARENDWKRERDNYQDARKLASYPNMQPIEEQLDEMEAEVKEFQTEIKLRRIELSSLRQASTAEFAQLTQAMRAVHAERRSIMECRQKNLPGKGLS